MKVQKMKKYKVDEIKSYIDRMKCYDKIVKHTLVGDLLVSTARLGLNHGYKLFLYPQATMLIFETMIFNRPSVEQDLLGKDMYLDRYTTEEEALEAHEKACEVARKMNEGTYEVD